MAILRRVRPRGRQRTYKAAPSAAILLKRHVCMTADSRSETGDVTPVRKSLRTASLVPRKRHIGFTWLS